MPKLLTGIAGLIVSTSMMSHAQSSQAIPVADNETAKRWFVELSSPPNIDGTGSRRSTSEEADFHTAAAGSRRSVLGKPPFPGALCNGVTVSATGRDVIEAPIASRRRRPSIPS